MKHYNLCDDSVEIILDNGTQHVIYFTSDSGKIYYRNKINTISNVRHPGIFLGVDINGWRWFMHNHYDNGRPQLVPEWEFTKGQPIYLSDAIPLNTQAQIIQSGLQQILSCVPYSWLNYNCQSFVNQAQNNKNSSEDVTKWFERTLVGLFLFAVFKSL